MVFGKRFFIILFSGFSMFIFFQIIYRKAFGLDMITFRDLMNYFSSLSLDNFTFGEAFINFLNSITDFSPFQWGPTEDFVDAIFNIFSLLGDFFSYIYGIMNTLTALMNSITHDLIVVVYFFRNFFGFLFT